MPRPASVEDEDPIPVEEQLDSHSTTSAPASPTAAPEASTETTEKAASPSVADIQRDFEHLLLNRAAPCAFAFARQTAQSSTSNDIPVSRGAAAREKWFAEIAGVRPDRQAALGNKTAPSACPVANTYSVYCNQCNHPIPDEHYHCSTCDEGDYDLCQDCVDSGILCGGEGHWMIKRFVKNGKVINSTTETIAPKMPFGESRTTLVAVEETKEVSPSRTCNSCIQGKSRSEVFCYQYLTNSKQSSQRIALLLARLVRTLTSVFHVTLVSSMATTPSMPLFQQLKI